MNAHLESLRQRRSYASLLLSYSCTVACEHCCFACSPREGAAVMSVEDALAHLKGFHTLNRMIHIAGGEPFLHYDRVREIVHAAYREGIAPHFIESNGSWCVSDELARERFQELRDHGVLWMLISTDPYHLRCIPVERIARALRIAEEVFGEGTTMGLTSEEDLVRRAERARDETAWRQFIAHEPPRLVGRAAREFTRFYEPMPIGQLGLESRWGRDPDDTCRRDWDPLWEIHVDPYGNVQTNCGILLGNANETPIAELMGSWHERNPLLDEFSKRGVAALLEWGVDYGFPRPERSPQKCFLCFSLRAFLRRRDDRFKAIFGPDEIYEAEGRLLP